MRCDSTSRPGTPEAVTTTLTLLTHRTVRDRFIPCPACCNATIEDFAQDANGDGIVTCLNCGVDFDPEALR